MERKLGTAIWAARRAAGLTQKELGKRLGLKAQTVRRWEWEDASPSPANRTAMLAAIAALNPEAARKLVSVLDAELNQATGAAVVPAHQAVTTPPVSGREALRFAILKMSDQLNVPPRSVREATARLLIRLRAANLSLDVAQQELDAWIANAELD